MSRLAGLTPADLSPAQRRLYEAITGGQRGRGRQSFPLTDPEGRLVGPFNAMLFHPPVGDALQRLGAAIRYQGRLPARAREIAVLAVAAHWRCGFEQRAHEAVGAGAGLTAAELAALRDRAPLPLADPIEAAVLDTTRRLLAGADLAEEHYRAAVATLGPDGLVELTTLVGYYGMLALQLRVFAVD